ncbi:hypothetical protein P280DRAFT_471203 [Massarina eburnea CBS 473.64]|uniref:Uncharacterized protein n=1 Tax=Massarina eburnea CBS 473.64 TaxID=1395130 RepID=A0A6A6RSM4_9PLEO|nr:hypothetical protein P280DRAFT_471203 [Massarina eburnea CBS 473.64]
MQFLCIELHSGVYRIISGHTPVGLGNLALQILTTPPLHLHIPATIPSVNGTEFKGGKRWVSDISTEISPSFLSPVVAARGKHWTRTSALRTEMYASRIEWRRIRKAIIRSILNHGLKSWLCGEGYALQSSRWVRLFRAYPPRASYYYSRPLFSLVLRRFAQLFAPS